MFCWSMKIWQNVMKVLQNCKVANSLVSKCLSGHGNINIFLIKSFIYKNANRKYGAFTMNNHQSLSLHQLCSQLVKVPDSEPRSNQWTKGPTSAPFPKKRSNIQPPGEVYPEAAVSHFRPTPLKKSSKLLLKGNLRD